LIGLGLGFDPPAASARVGEATLVGSANGPTRSYQLLFGVRKIEHGVSLFGAIRVDYRVGERRYRSTGQHGLKLCAPSSIMCHPTYHVPVHAVVIAEPGSPDVLTWTEVPDPEPTTGEVLIEVAASAVNRADLLQRQGLYNPPPGASAYPGLECSGTIVAVGDGVIGWEPGQQVCALLSGGGYAERVAVPAGQVLPVPRGLSVVEAAALPEVACTVWSNVVDLAHLRPGETMLIHGGGSGIGTFAIQLAKQLGATVITTARKPKHDALKRLGADVCIDYTAEDFTEVAKDVDVILDNMGASYLDRNVRALGEGGRLVMIGMQGGRTGELNIGSLMQKRGTIIATALRSRPPAQKASIVRGVRDEVWPLIDEGLIKPVIDRTVAMANAAEAHRVVEASENLGKVLLAT
jgi:putative PIG3 family NAD(P)H quinone oxidoreductase